MQRRRQFVEDLFILFSIVVLQIVFSLLLQRQNMLIGAALSIFFKSTSTSLFIGSTFLLKFEKIS
jgi:hypothetical protein